MVIGRTKEARTAAEAPGLSRSCFGLLPPAPATSWAQLRRLIGGSASAGSKSRNFEICFWLVGAPLLAPPASAPHKVCYWGGVPPTRGPTGPLRRPEVPASVTREPAVAVMASLECPVFQATHRDITTTSFAEFVEKHEKDFAEFGVCKIVPPRGWKPRREGYASLNFMIPR